MHVEKTRVGVPLGINVGFNVGSNIGSKVIEKGGKKIVIRNDVPYIERLDKGWSAQARAIVKPVLNRTRKP